jgi:hypothetical protein
LNMNSYKNIHLIGFEQMREVVTIDRIQHHLLHSVGKVII